MLFTYIRELQKKPEKVRKRHAIVLTVVITVFVVLIYFFSMYLTSLGTRSINNDTGQTDNTETDMRNMFDSSNMFLDEVNLQQKEEKKPAQQDWSNNIEKINNTFNTIPVDIESENVNQSEDTTTTTTQHF
jgi:predicted PurR-regulated permease PerM